MCTSQDQKMPESIQQKSLNRSKINTQPEFQLTLAKQSSPMTVSFEEGTLNRQVWK